MAGITSAVSLPWKMTDENYGRRLTKRAQQALTNASVEDFLVVEYNGEIGGRVAHTTFGKKADGTPYTVELGSNPLEPSMIGVSDAN